MAERILIVDDEETLCEVLKLNLENEGCDVDIAFSAEEALTHDLTSYSLILLDIKMGEISGIKMTKILKADVKTATSPSSSARHATRRTTSPACAPRLGTTLRLLAGEITVNDFDNTQLCCIFTPAKEMFLPMNDIRKATIANIPTIRELAAIAFPQTYSTILSPEQIDYMMKWMYSEQSLRRQMTEEGHIYYIAQQDGMPIGYLSIQPEGEDAYHLQKLYILPDYQGMGWGKRLFLHATKVIKELHPAPCRMLLNVNRHNEALHFYQKMGMTKVSEGDFAIGGGYYMNDYIMGLDL